MSELHPLSRKNLPAPGTPTPIIVTKPGVAGRTLSEELHLLGADVLWFPAFDIGPAPDGKAARALLADLEQFDLAIFVSPAAVNGAAALMSAPWPSAVTIGAVGSVTRAAVAREIEGAAAARMLVPAANAPARSYGEETDAGSEALWHTLQATALAPRKVLVLRAESGRDWLLERLAETGAQVTTVAVYSRAVHSPTGAELAWLAQRAENAPAPFLVFSSSQAVAALAQQLHNRVIITAWTRRGVALASHPRVVNTLRAGGFAQVVLTQMRAALILAATQQRP